MIRLISAINLIADGIDPFTGEVFDKTDLTNNYELSLAITRLAVATQPHLKLNKKLWKWPQINPCSEQIFNLLKEWRLEQSRILGVPAYIIFSDTELHNISEAIISRKDDLLLVKGIANGKYEIYGDEIYKIINNFNRD